MYCYCTMMSMDNNDEKNGETLDSDKLKKRNA